VSVQFSTAALNRTEPPALKRAFGGVTATFTAGMLIFTSAKAPSSSVLKARTTAVAGVLIGGTARYTPVSASTVPGPETKSHRTGASL
jgi:hypothetical protein